MNKHIHEELRASMVNQAHTDLLTVLRQGRTPTWWHEGPDLAADVVTALTAIADDGEFYWLDTNAKIKQETTDTFNLEQQANALALVRHLQNDLGYIKPLTYDAGVHAYSFVFTELGRLVFELWEDNQDG